MRKQLQPIYLQLCTTAVLSGVLESGLFGSFERYCLATTEAEKRKAIELEETQAADVDFDADLEEEGGEKENPLAGFDFDFQD